MRVSDYIVKYIAERGVKYAFGYPGGMVTYLMDSFDNNKNITAQALYHEQAAAFAACGYAQASGKIGVAYATSGPGATNLITGICHAYFESVSTLFITGQVNTNEAKGSLNVRQKGFQETDIIGMIDNVTKYSAYVGKAEDIKYYLDRAFYDATEGRPGPVLLDIPIDIQRSEINIDDLKGFTPVPKQSIDYSNIVKIIVENLKISTKPVIIIGNGVNIAGVTKDFKKILDKLGVPIVTSMIAIDVISTDYKYNFGFIGTYGHRHANLIIAQSDLVISFGSRLDVRQTGANIKEFAKDARLIRVDIDQNEFENNIKQNEIDIVADLKELVKYLSPDGIFNDYAVPKKWINQCQYYKTKLSQIDQMFPNQFVNLISDLIPDGSITTTDVGQNQVWVAQSFHVKSTQRILFSGGHGSMGYSLPAAIGAYYADKKPVYCFTGDGGLQMNIQELQFLAREKIPVKIFILNNHSLGMIRHFQEMYFKSNCTQTVNMKGYSNPDFSKVSGAYGIRSHPIYNFIEICQFKEELMDPNPVLFDINVGDKTYIYPKAAFNKAIYEQEPELDKELLDEILSFEG